MARPPQPLASPAPPREFPLASTEKLLAWPGLTPLARQALEWERGTGQRAVVQSPETSETAQAWARLVRVVHALMTHPDLALPPKMQWALSVNSAKVVAAPSPDKGVSIGVGWDLWSSSRLQSWARTPVETTWLPAALVCHPLVALRPSDRETLLPFFEASRQLPLRSAPVAEILTWWATVEQSAPALARFFRADAERALDAALPPAPARSGPRL